MARIKPSMFVGDRFVIQGQEVVVLEYLNRHRVRILFENGYECFTRVSHIRDENVRNPLRPSICDVGYKGIGEYDSSNSRKAYQTWVDMLRRCYDLERQKKHPTYRGCSVEPYWHNFQYFCEWYRDKFTEDKIDWVLDKDILYTGNKVYSRDTCTPVPESVNSLLTDSKQARGKCPIGVSWSKGGNKFVANCQVDGMHIYLGRFSTATDAFYAYKQFKEDNIKRVAAKWKDKIDPRAYNALMNYEVEITD